MYATLIVSHTNNGESFVKDHSPLAFISPDTHPDDYQHAYHPKSFSEYIGQQDLVRKLHVYTQAALHRKEPLDHTLLFGPPGLGKTTLANIVAYSMSSQITICSGPMMERSGDIVALLSNLNARDILFIDEIHRMPTHVEEVLYNAMEHFRVDIIIGQGAGAKSVNLPLNPFTLIGATTKNGMLSAPLRSRFGISERIDFYTDEELQRIIQQATTHLMYTIDQHAALRIAQSARGTPRIAKNILRRVRDIAQMAGTQHISPDITEQTLSFLGIDKHGLCTVDRSILTAISETYQGGPVGLETIAAMVGEDSATLEEVYEPYLMRKGLLERTPRGRKIPESARLLVHKVLGSHSQLSLNTV